MVTVSQRTPISSAAAMSRRPIFASVKHSVAPRKIAPAAPSCGQDRLPRRNQLTVAMTGSASPESAMIDL